MSKLTIKTPGGQQLSIPAGLCVVVDLEIITTSNTQVEDGSCTALHESIEVCADVEDWYITGHKGTDGKLYSKDIRNIPVVGKMLHAVCLTQLIKKSLE